MTSDPRSNDRLAPYGCGAALEELQRILDGEAPADPERLEAHRRACPDCRPLFAAIPVFLDGLRQLPRPVAPDSLTDQTCRAVLIATRHRSRWRRLGVTAGLAVAASAAIVAVTLWQEWRRPERGPMPRERVVEVPPPPLRAKLAEAGTAVVALTRRTADATLERTLNMLPRPQLPSGAFPAARLDPALQSLEEVRTGAAASLEPIADTARRAFQLFRRELTPADPGGKPRT